MKLLIVNADDFGLNDAATAAIIECHLAGTVTSTTMMVNAPATQAAGQLALAHPDLGVGLHFNLTWGAPLSAPADVRSLVDDQGGFLPRSTLLRRALLGKLLPEHVRSELAAQVARFRQLGLEPTHVDSHQHVHASGIVFDAIACFCESASLPMRVPWVAEQGQASFARRLRRRVLSGLLNSATQKWAGRVRWNAGLGSIFDVGGNADSVGEAGYTAILKSAAAGDFELMVHPVNDAAAMQGYTTIGQVAEAEYRYLRTGKLSSIAADLGFRLGTYRDLVA